jgi:hypothetical protein
LKARCIPKFDFERRQKGHSEDSVEESGGTSSATLLSAKDNARVWCRRRRNDPEMGNGDLSTIQNGSDRTTEAKSKTVIVNSAAGRQ